MMEFGKVESEELEKLNAQLVEAQLVSKRWQAEYVNYQQRVSREREADRKFALEGLLRELLPAIDSMQRTQEALKEAQAGTLRAVEMAERDLLRVLSRYGVQPMGAREIFDPAVHNAIESTEVADKPEGSIIEVIQPGYMIHDRVLRAATVRVAKKPREQI